jgi:hypothetical protein
MRGYCAEYAPRAVRSVVMRIVRTSVAIGIVIVAAAGCGQPPVSQSPSPAPLSRSPSRSSCCESAKEESYRSFVTMRWD